MSAGAKFSALAAALAVVGSAAVATREEPKADVKPIVIPFELLSSNHMAIKAEINGKGPYRLIFDVGAPFTVLGSKAAKETGVSNKRGGGGFLLGIERDRAMKSLKVGDVVSKDIPVLVMDHPVVDALSSFFRPLHGIVGYTFFARYKTTIDYQARTMSLEPVDFQVTNFLENLEERMMAPKVARKEYLSASGLWGIALGTPEGGVASPGMPIRSVTPGSAAEAAGLRAGDVLTSLDGRWTTSATDIYKAAAKAPESGEVAVEVLREGKPLALTVRARPGL